MRLNGRVSGEMETMVQSSPERSVSPSGGDRRATMPRLGEELPRVPAALNVLSEREASSNLRARPGPAHVKPH